MSTPSEMDFVAAQEVLSRHFPLEVLEALNVCVRGVSRAVAEDVYAGKAKPASMGLAGQRTVDEIIADDPMLSAAYATSPTDTGAGEGPRLRVISGGRAPE